MEIVAFCPLYIFKRLREVEKTISDIYFSVLNTWDQFLLLGFVCNALL